MSRTNRLESVDIARGAIVATMILVNFSLVEADYRRFAVYPTLVHAQWIGFHLADFVFPAFIFIVGVSIALTSPADGGVDAQALGRILWRAAKLFLLGFALSNFLWLWMHGWALDGGFRIMGVLQRISLCYVVTAVLFRWMPAERLPWLAGILLLLYWPLVLKALPDGTPADLLRPGMNFVSWFDREWLGPHRYVEGPAGYDSEGLLSTLPAIAQCLIGAAAGASMRSFIREGKGLGDFAARGLLLLALGILWARWFPIIKDLWTSSFVAVSSGLCMLLLALLQALVARGWMPRPLSTFCRVFGVNALLVYAVQFLALTLIAVPVIATWQVWLSTQLPPAAASLVLSMAYVGLIWLAFEPPYRMGIHFRP